MEKIKFGILGNAAIARNQMIPAIEGSEYCEVYAVASRSSFPADVAPAAVHYDSYEALLSDEKVQAVYIPVPNGLHKEWAIKAMRAGKHVLCEKPIAMNKEEAEEMFRVSHETGMLLMEAFMYRFTDKTKKMLEIIESGAIGNVKNIHVNHGYTLNWDSPARQEPSLGGGSMYDVGCYCVSFSNLVAGEAPEDLHAGFIMTERGYDEHAVAWLKYPSGIMASLESWFDGAGDQRALIVGTKGTLEVPNFPGGGEDNLILKAGGERKEIPVTPVKAYMAEADEFAKKLLGLPAFLLPEEETLRNMETLDRIHTFRK